MLALTTTTISSVCSKCGTVAKSGKMSCCGRGGSWFGNCGSAGNTKLGHTWFQGFQACKKRAESKEAIGLHPHAAQQLNSSNDSEMSNSKIVITTTLARPPMTNTSTGMLMTALAYTYLHILLFILYIILLWNNLDDYPSSLVFICPIRLRWREMYIYNYIYSWYKYYYIDEYCINFDSP